MTPIESAATFLRMAAIELRKIAEFEPQCSAELSHIADQCEAEAAGLISNDNQAPPSAEASD